MRAAWRERERCSTPRTGESPARAIPARPPHVKSGRAGLTNRIRLLALVCTSVKATPDDRCVTTRLKSGRARRQGRRVQTRPEHVVTARKSQQLSDSLEDSWLTCASVYARVASWRPGRHIGSRHSRVMRVGIPRQRRGAQTVTLRKSVMARAAIAHGQPKRRPRRASRCRVGGGHGRVTLTRSQSSLFPSRLSPCPLLSSLSVHRHHV